MSKIANYLRNAKLDAKSAYVYTRFQNSIGERLLALMENHNVTREKLEELLGNNYTYDLVLEGTADLETLCTVFAALNQCLFVTTEKMFNEKDS
jgi:transcriptional regulator with XRE-family HTH domain